MEFVKARLRDFESIMLLLNRAKDKLIAEHIYQWDERYPKPEMIMSDIRNGYTYLVLIENKMIGFYTSNSICEDDVHEDINWLYSGDKWIILHRLCIDPHHQDNGLGQSIVLKYEEVAQKHGFFSSRIDVFATNEKAIHIYEKLGYVRVGNAMCERGPFFIYEKMLK